ncbi:MAG: glycosyltransferase family 2 protein [Methanosarcinales archaeon Met12]|nr:MAG: glycosyltransferase family 2 protein [Methanosarcinales archaeon Met12]
MTRDKISVSIIIPAYNEEKRITRTLTEHQAFAHLHYPDYEILVVCDGCTDRTPAIVRDFHRRNSRIKLLVFRHKLGKGGGVLEGFKAARNELVGFTDADDSISPEDFDKLVKAVDGGADCAIASRHTQGAKIFIQQPLSRRVASRVFNLFVKLLFGLPFEDTQCGAKMVKKTVIDDIVPRMVLKGFEFDVELLWRIQKSGYIIEEIPITWQHKDNSAFSLKYAPQMFFNLLKVRFG